MDFKDGVSVKDLIRRMCSATARLLMIMASPLLNDPTVD